MIVGSRIDGRFAWSFSTGVPIDTYQRLHRQTAVNGEDLTRDVFRFFAS
jgi:hypothetical protein